MSQSQKIDAVKKIVIISYATYPGISPRHLRTNELSKELARKGHDVTLYVLKGGYDYSEYENDNNIKVKSLGCTYLFDFNHKSGVKLSFHMRVLRKLLGRYFELPFLELVFNSYNAIKKEKDIDLLITVAVPYPLHWGVALFRQRHKESLENTVWVADCGDPYMGSPFQKKPFYFKWVEKWFCEKTDFISIPIKEAKEAYYPEFSEKIKIIPQGFNFDDIKINKMYLKNTVPTFLYAGSFYKDLRDPRPFLDYLVSLDEDFKFIIYTNGFLLIKKYKEILGDKIQIFNYIPREKLIFEMGKADFLVNLENPSKSQSPSKLIDYGLSERPILSINTNKEIDINLIREFLSGNYSKALVIEDFEKYNIKNVANSFLNLINKK